MKHASKTEAPPPHGWSKFQPSVDFEKHKDCKSESTDILSPCTFVPPWKLWGSPSVVRRPYAQVFPHTCTHCHTYKRTVTRHSGNCTPTLEISIMELAISWRSLQLKVIPTRDSWTQNTALVLTVCLQPIRQIHSDIKYILQNKQLGSPNPSFQMAYKG